MQLKEENCKLKDIAKGQNEVEQLKIENKLMRLELQKMRGSSIAGDIPILESERSTDFTSQGFGLPSIGGSSSVTASKKKAGALTYNSESVSPKPVSSLNQVRRGDIISKSLIINTKSIKSPDVVSMSNEVPHHFQMESIKVSGNYDPYKIA
jgi:hypothetical protein